jgi:hypothetical protein
MTPIFCCGFECGQAGTVGQHWDFTTGTPTFDTSVVRTGARSLKLPTGDHEAKAVVFSSSSTVVVGRFYLYITADLFSATCVIIQTTLAGTIRAYIAYNSSSGAKIFAGTGPGFIAGGVDIAFGQWYLIDFKMDVSANPWTCDVKVNGIPCLQDTTFLAATTMDSFYVARGGETRLSSFYIDDFVLSYTAADYPIGAGHVNHFVPTSDGTHNVAGAADFRRGGTTTDILNATTDAYLLVNDVPLDDTTPDTDDHIRIVAPANVTDYVEGVYGPASGVSTPTVAPRAVEVIAEFFAAGTGLSDEIFKLNDNGTVDNVYDGTQIAGTTTGIYKTKQYATAPTGGAWTVVSGAGNFNNIRFRYGYATDANPDKSLMCTMIEAEFAEDPARVPRPTSVGHPFIV